MHPDSESNNSHIEKERAYEMTTMMVLKRDGRHEPVSFDKITVRIEKLKNLNVVLENVDSILIAQKVVAGLRHGVKTSELDDLASECSEYMSTIHPEYSVLASRIAISNMHKSTVGSMSSIVNLLNPVVLEFVKTHMDVMDKEIGDCEKDYNYSYIGFKTLKKSYLMKDPKTDQCLERMQVMLMRISATFHSISGGNIDECLKSYRLMSEGYFTHATPTMFNAGTNFQQLASCFLLTVKSDSIEGIADTWKRCALISKSAGGIGVSITNVRCNGSKIHSSNGHSRGIVPMARVFNEIAAYVDQGGGKRKGAFALYIEPWHGDIEEFLDLKKNRGKEELRARDLFYGLWIPDLFMKRVESNSDWSLFCPEKCKDLADLYGLEFEERYLYYETNGYAIKKVAAQSIWTAIIDSQIETGTPYMLYKDACNEKSNQKNLGTIKNSNLCTEIVEYSDPDEIAVCNLASIALPKFYNNGVFDFDKLGEVVKVVTNNLNNVIDCSSYPLEETKHSNSKHRPIGLGVQGLADLFFEFNIPFDSDEARKLNRDIFEHIYYYALKTSCELSKKHGSYSSFKGSPASKGILQFDMWGVEPSNSLDWTQLKSDIIKYGLRNSLLVAPMPTASTAQILGNTECFEPITSNMYTRRVLSGEFTVVNKYLIKYLQSIGMWNSQVRDEIIKKNGSVQSLTFMSDEAKKVFRTVWEMKMKSIIDMAADRGAFIDQSQSMNLFMETPSHQKITSMHFYGWKKGLKTGMYYLRTRPASDAIKVTCSLKNRGDCEACSA